MWVALSLEGGLSLGARPLDSDRGAAQCELKPCGTLQDFHSSVLCLCAPIEPASPGACQSGKIGFRYGHKQPPHLSHLGQQSFC